MDNKENDFKPGDVICRHVTQVPVANHYGVYIGDGQVIDSTVVGIEKIHLNVFAEGCDVSVKRYCFYDVLPRKKIVETALHYYKNKEKWGEFNLFLNNCRHFTTYCATGHKSSGRVKIAILPGSIGVSIGMAATAVLVAVNRAAALAMGSRR